MKLILTEPQAELLKEERHWLADLQLLLASLGAAPADQETLRDAIRQLDELFLLVVVGEFNAGKSAFINALLGQPLLKEGVTPTTAQVNLLKFGETHQNKPLTAHLHILAEPVEILRQINIVDTPGTNAIVREHQVITEQFVPRADIVLFITSAERPFTESERAFLEQIKAWGKKVVVVINKIDILETAADQEEVVNFVQKNAPLLLGQDVTPDIFPVSARRALKAKQGEPAQWADSGFEPLEHFIHDRLDETGRLRLKLVNPLGVGERLIRKYQEMTTHHLTLLQDDTETLANLERQFDLYRRDMTRDFGFRMADIENILYEMEKRGDAYFDDTLRLVRIRDLLHKEQIRRTFEEKVVANVSQEVEQKVEELIDWLVSADLNQWQGVMNYLEQRKQVYQDQLVGEMSRNFRYDRDRLLDSVGRSAHNVVDTYDKKLEAQKIAAEAQMAVAGTTLAGVGAVGLGAAIAILTTSTAVDITGFLTASLLAALGIFVIPARRQSAKKELAARMAALRLQLTEALRGQFEAELNGSLQHINAAIAPYTRFVRAQQERWSETHTQLAGAQREQGRLRVEIERI
jgi:small GTP-binding protein